MRLLKNFRRGFATNSSSSHSFVYLKEPVADHDPGIITEDEFQWNDFRLDTLRAKLFYVLAGKIGGSWGGDAQALAATKGYEDLKDQFPEFGMEEFHRAAGSMGVDHQSRGTISAEQARDPRLVLFGGNDNDGDSHERAAAIARGEVDWSRSSPQYSDDLRREDFPMQDGDMVRFKNPKGGEVPSERGGLWQVIDTPNNTTVSLLHRDLNGEWGETLYDIPVPDVEIVDEKEDR